MTSSNEEEGGNIVYIDDCRTPEGRKKLFDKYDFTTHLRFISPGFKTCGQKSRELIGFISVFTSKRRPDGKEYRLVCGEHCAAHFCQLIRKQGGSAEWPAVHDPYVRRPEPRRYPNAEGGASSTPGLSKSQPPWVIELVQVCNILLMRLRFAKGPLLNIFSDLQHGKYAEKQIQSVNTAAFNLRARCKFDNISDLATQLDTELPKKLWRPNLSLLEAIYLGKFSDPTKECVLR